jgi:predicted nucleic acid-binding protein
MASGPQVDFRDDPHAVDTRFRVATAHLSKTAAPKSLADCYLLSVSQAGGAKLVTFDSGLHKLARMLGDEALLLPQ